MSDRPLDAGDITALLGEVADELNDDAGRRIVAVGGALLALHGLREATRDVDSTTVVPTRTCGMLSPGLRPVMASLRRG